MPKRRRPIPRPRHIILPPSIRILLRQPQIRPDIRAVDHALIQLPVIVLRPPGAVHLRLPGLLLPQLQPVQLRCGVVVLLQEGAVAHDLPVRAVEELRAVQVVPALPGDAEFFEQPAAIRVGAALAVLGAGDHDVLRIRRRRPLRRHVAPPHPRGGVVGEILTIRMFPTQVLAGGRRVDRPGVEPVLPVRVAQVPVRVPAVPDFSGLLSPVGHAVLEAALGGADFGDAEIQAAADLLPAVLISLARRPHRSRGGRRVFPAHPPQPHRRRGGDQPHPGPHPPPGPTGRSSPVSGAQGLGLRFCLWRAPRRP
mmetsp:Transcript_93977/g.251580  ORF Transcript_93977/g.251580 Transcript_93977/m.251580 type:complete len:310 (+) Transcript_93977:995-1924(+)